MTTNTKGMSDADARKLAKAMLALMGAPAKVAKVEKATKAKDAGAPPKGTFLPWFVPTGEKGVLRNAEVEELSVRAGERSGIEGFFVRRIAGAKAEGCFEAFVPTSVYEQAREAEANAKGKLVVELTKPEQAVYANGNGNRAVAFLPVAVVEAIAGAGQAQAKAKPVAKSSGNAFEDALAANGIVALYSHYASKRR